MRAKATAVIQLCIEQGIAAGFARAYKHDECPSTVTIQEAIERALWEQLDDYFDFEEQHARKD